MEKGFAVVTSQGQERQRDSRARATAIVLGIFYPLSLTVVLSLVWGLEFRSSALEMAGYIAGYGVLGAILGFIWPKYGWALPVWLVAFWVFLLLVSLLFSDPVPWNPKLVLKELAWHMSVVIAAFLGLAVGKTIGSRRIASP